MLQGILLIAYYVVYTVDVEHGKLLIHRSPAKDLVFVVFHATLFIIVNRLLIPKLFYKKRYLLFLWALLGCLTLYGIIEEGIIEYWLYPDSRGRDPVTLSSIYWYWGEIIGVLVVFMCIQFVGDNLENQRKIEQIEKDRLDSELKFLRSQIQPHMLFNSLNNIYAHALAKSEKVPDLILQLANVLRYILYEANTEKVALSKELAVLEEYIALQKIPLKKRGEVISKIHRGTSEKALYMAPLLLIPFVENSFKHSLNSLATGIEIRICIEVIKNVLHFEVQNNYQPQVVTSDTLTSQGIGLENVKKRLKILYPEQHTLIVEKTATTFLVKLTLQLPMKPLKCLIIEDQLPAQEILTGYLQEVPRLELVAAYVDPLAAITLLETTKIDILFLDVHLPKISGIDFLKSLQSTPHIILTTAFPEYALEGFELDVVDYLLKPFSFERFLRAIAKIERIVKSDDPIIYQQALFVKTKGIIQKIKIEEILLVEAKGDFVLMYTLSEKYIVSTSLQNSLQLLGEQFVRCHKSFIVNVTYIEKIIGNTIQLRAYTIPIGRTFREGFLEKLNML